MERIRRGVIVWVLGIWLAGSSSFAGASDSLIYMYRDDKGVMHFTNTPTSSKYKIFSKQFVSYPPIIQPPSSYDDHIRKAAAYYSLPFSLVKSVIKVESNFNPRAVSDKGATGLMQIMPFNFNDLEIENPYDPRQNILGGACYLKRMLDRFNGELSLAIAAYNAGPEAVAKYQSIPPYPETQDYVRQVLKYYQLYRNQV
jgi:soluble lytic murein transglycosylase-like protein